MCGIAGIFGEGVNEQELRQMAECHRHRGPDSQGIHQSKNVGLAHTRLSIIDPASGDQPIYNEDGDVTVIFNGEIYNYQELREALGESGHRFSTGADTEVLVHLYEEHGPEFISRLDGMFAFALWDSTEERLILARDPMGIKPLLYVDDGRRLAFGSELPAVLEANVNHGGLDRWSIELYFALGYIPAPRTAFCNVKKLSPGEVLVVSEEGIERDRFYTPTLSTSRIPYDEAIEGVRNRLESSIQKRLMSDVPLGAFLSGGIDSTIIAGTMAKYSNKPIKTYTVGFEEALFDESWAAREAAGEFGTDHTEFTVRSEDVREAIPEVIDRLGEPFADQSLLPTYLISERTSDSVKVALSGDGADELFAGYNRYRGEYLSKYYRSLPKPVRKRVIEPLIGRLSASRSSRRGEFVRKAQKFTRGGSSAITDRHFQWSRIAEGPDSAFVTIRPNEAGKEAFRTQHTKFDSYRSGTNIDDLGRIQAVDTYFGLPNQILHKTDLASMYNSLEVRVPFLDTNLVEYAMSLPTGYKIDSRRQKSILKDSFDDILPGRILQRGKQGFDMPIGEWFKNELEQEFSQTLKNLDSALIDTDAVFDYYAEHKRGNQEHGKFLWSVYVFARWHNRMKREGII